MNQKLNPEKPEALFVQANRLIEEGKPVKAAKILIRLIGEYSNYGRAYNHLGFLWETEFRNLDKAEECYKTCLQHSPEYPAIYYNYAVLLSTLERFEELGDLLNKALKVPGITQSKIHNEYGIMFEKQGNYSEAIKSYQKALSQSFDQKEMEMIRASIQRTEEKMLGLGQVIRHNA